MEIISYSDARNNLKAVMDRAVNDHVPIAITRQRGRPVVMIDLDDWNAMHETNYLRSTPNNARRLLDAIDELNDGSNTIYVDPDTMKPL